MNAYVNLHLIQNQIFPLQPKESQDYTIESTVYNNYPEITVTHGCMCVYKYNLKYIWLHCSCLLQRPDTGEESKCKLK